MTVLLHAGKNISVIFSRVSYCKITLFSGVFYFHDFVILELFAEIKICNIYVNHMFSYMLLYVQMFHENAQFASDQFTNISSKNKALVNNSEFFLSHC